MANSAFGYVRQFELDDRALPDTWLVIRLDGKGFHKFSERHRFDKPNDRRALELMNAAAVSVMGSDFGQQGRVCLGFGESDEFSFVLHKSCALFNRRQGKLASTCVSLFTSFYVRLWPTYFPDEPLAVDEPGPSFDARLVQYPSEDHVRDYFKWRQVDTHINNLYNTCFWALVQQGGCSTKEAHAELKGTVSSQKNELLFKRFSINYNEVDLLYRRGSVLLKRPAVADEPLEDAPSHDENTQGETSKKKKKGKQKMKMGPVQVVHDDMLKDEWWTLFWQQQRDAVA